MISPIIDIFQIRDDPGFELAVLDTFRYQAKHCIIYRKFLNYLGVEPTKLSHMKEIPFLPVEFFKFHRIISDEFDETIIFTSSGTGSSLVSRHFIHDTGIYTRSFLSSFRLFYGDPADYCILALLPSYLERKGSSLIFMVKELMLQSGYPHNGFFLDNHDELAAVLQANEKKKQKTILIGVSFALLEFARKFSLDLRSTFVMETGGMKGRGEELTKAEMHEFLCARLGVKSIHSEYGMTELLSQAYSDGNGKFKSPPWMKILIRDIDDPFHYVGEFRSGGINIIDLANMWSCSFIETKDIGRMGPDGYFEVLGRMDNSDIRGCNLMVM